MREAEPRWPETGPGDPGPFNESPSPDLYTQWLVRWYPRRAPHHWVCSAASPHCQYRMSSAEKELVRRQPDL